MAQITSEMPLSTLYMQAQYVDTAEGVLRLGSKPTEIEIREAYRAIILRVHPDKAPSESLRELHTSLLKKVHAAYEKLLRDCDGHAGHDCTIPETQTVKPLPETPESLRARNIDFRGALEREREAALQAKRSLDAQKASIDAKNERLAEKRAARAKENERLESKRQQKISKKNTQIAKREVLILIKNGAPTAMWKPARKPAPVVDDWEEEEARLEREEPDAIDYGTKCRSKLQNKPTGDTAQPLFDRAANQPVASDADIKHRWDKSLLSGGRSGSVSLIEKRKREESGAARAHKQLMALCEGADGLHHPKRLSALEEEEVLLEAFLRGEEVSEMTTEEVLSTMDAEVIAQHSVHGERNHLGHRAGNTFGNRLV